MSTVPHHRDYFRFLSIIGIVVVHTICGLVGLVSLLIGVLLTMTLLLAPIGIPLAVTGLALLASVGQPSNAIED